MIPNAVVPWRNVEKYAIVPVTAASGSPAASMSSRYRPLQPRPRRSHVNRIKMLKRQMYGRANPALLRKRVLLAG